MNKYLYLILAALFVTGCAPSVTAVTDESLSTSTWAAIPTAIQRVQVNGTPTADAYLNAQVTMVFVHATDTQICSCCDQRDTD